MAGLRTPSVSLGTCQIRRLQRLLHGSERCLKRSRILRALTRVLFQNELEQNGYFDYVTLNRRCALRLAWDSIARLRISWRRFI